MPGVFVIASEVPAVCTNGFATFDTRPKVRVLAIVEWRVNSDGNSADQETSRDGL